ncbi:Trk system potassium transporter TrkA [Clostridium tepidum]|jgi:trk system potassium uptake protein TrkA|uniref:Trk system potassium uptake protein TrkA n=1 Tax=Clostridium tepidum TaxID=1962263 RepID=A0A1S9I442_9CLOT|nr:Trk system potassium transporter TrkA [Clostridium tepidum]MCR1933325.1 Trk system potassium transporter TrkA [Clostridium tepidum]MDU6877486.1 Trk system potassium transporter TrkA [Clostridium botulinum]OOO62625.1 Trk system potassium transport protein TrkA [Clostridium tepidum]OOO65063.1 Trk system potassium transport protein TrkA [Clostridium tepidum]
MHIIIVGNGKVGYTLAKHLCQEDNDVIVIDKNAEALQKAMDSLDVMCIRGNGTRVNVLKEAEVSSADVVIAVTNSDERNMLCCLAAKKFGAKHTIARIRDPEYAEELTMLKRELEIDMIINPEKEAALEIAQLIKFPTVSSVENFAQGKVDLVSFRLGAEDFIAGKSISDIDFKQCSVLFCAVERNDRVFMPTGDFVLKNNDKVYVIGDHGNITLFLKYLGKHKNKIKNVMIVGGGRITYYLTKLINKVGATIKIVEKSYEKCKYLNETLPEAIIINGDGTEQELLESENLKDVDAFIALTDRDEENIVASLFALNEKVHNVITKVTRVNYNNIVKNIGVERVISPKTLTANKIITYVRGLKNKKGSFIENLYKIVGEQAEAVEFAANNTTKCLNISLKDIKIKKGVLIAAIVRNKDIIIPNGDDCIKSGDSVIIVTERNNIIDINNILDGGSLK